MTSSIRQQDIARQNRRPNLARRVGVVLLLLAVLFVGIFFARVGVQGWAIYQSGKRVEMALRADQSPVASLAVLRDEVRQVSQAVSAINRQAGPLLRLLEPLRGFTLYGSTLAAVPALMEAGDGLLSVVNDAVGLLTSDLIEAQGEVGLAELTAALDGAGPDLARLAPKAEAASALLKSIVADDLHPAVAEPLVELQLLAPLLPSGLSLAPYMSQLLGFDEPQSYLVLVQNNYELRATGGFISAAGLLTLENGRILQLDLLDSYQIYRKDGQYPPAPEPMQHYMDIPVMLFRDANWSPHLPISAQLAQSLYLQDTGNEVDGIITIDMHAVETLVGALEPLQVAGVDEPITGNNVVEFMKETWTAPLATDAVASEEPTGAWWTKRKDFMPALAGAAMQRLDAGNFDAVTLARAGLSALDSRSIQVWLPDPQPAAALADLGWDGGLVPTDGADFLALVDTNMGYNKVNAVVRQALEYSVTWPAEAGTPAIATATVTYHHPVEKPGHVCDHTPRYGDSYDDMLARCYFDYVRLYAPAGSRLLGAEGFDLDSVSSKRGENGVQVFTGWFVLPPGEEHTASFTYELPTAIGEDGYRLAVVRQSGSAPLPLRAQIGDQTFETVIERGRFEWQAE